MARVAEGMGRMADEIAANRKQRRDFLAEVKIATGHRQKDVKSFLQNTRSARGKTTQEQTERRRKSVKARHADMFSTLLGLQTSRTRAASVKAAEGKKMTRELRDEVRSMLKGQKTSRLRAARDNHKEAVETNSRRQGEVRAMLDQLAREGVARRQHRHEFADAQRERAAAFMRNLTNGVDGFRGKLAREGRDRAAEIRDHLSAYARDRREGLAMWRGTFQKSRPVKEQPGEALHSVIVRSAAASAPPHEPVAAPTHGATAPSVNPEVHADKTKSPQSGSARQPSRQPQGRHRGRTK